MKKKTANPHSTLRFEIAAQGWDSDWNFHKLESRGPAAFSKTQHRVGIRKKWTKQKAQLCDLFGPLFVNRGSRMRFQKRLLLPCS